ncbi:RimK family alpha-L-glutamate ligase [Micromonospora sp. NPDC047557]|uniref:ATP-grasp domain-containing protein n=1 Tax=Micromonospora sp. NPDC047557 TaxID=3364250 RepID=UPI003720850D
MTNHHQSTRGEPRVALVTCTELVDLDPDDRLVLDPLTARGIAVEAVVWDDPDADWSSYDLVVLRSPWDYALRRDEFVAWAASVPTLVNPADVVRWNTDKRYLAELSAAGVPTVPTSWVEPGETWSPPAETGEYVLKPSVSAGSQDTGRYDLADPEHRDLAHAHVRRLSTAGRTTMVQPYLSAVDSEGETALLFLAGPDGLAYSHAIRKGPMLTGPDLGPDGLYKAEEISSRAARPEQLAVAERALAAVPGGTRQLLYARVDLIPGPDGDPVLVELELTEPSLFIGYADGAPDRLATAIATHLARRP